MNRYRNLFFIIFITTAVIYLLPLSGLTAGSKNKAGDVISFDDLEMVYIPGGTFIMGTPKSEAYRSDNETSHKVKVSAFWMSKYETTQKQYKNIMNKNPSKNLYTFGPDGKISGYNETYPVEMVTWYDAVEFCNLLSEKNGLKPYYSIDKNNIDYKNTGKDIYKYSVTILGGNGFRLPTEAEWEYACRAGTKTAYNYGDKFDISMFNFSTELSGGKTIPVGSYKPNKWGLYDMHGNVQEWCWDWYMAYKGYAVNPKGPDSGGARVIRGGSFFWEYLRSGARFYSEPIASNFHTGFRVARSE